jgi:tetratricopeptide (TPR) repeat protein
LIDGRAACAALLGAALLFSPAAAEGDDILQLKDGRFVQGVPLKLSDKFVVASYKNGDVYVPLDLVEDYVIGGVVPAGADEESKAQRANGLVHYKGKWVKPEVRDKLVKKAIEDRKKAIEEAKAHAEWRNRWKFEGKYFSFESTLTPTQNEHYAALLDAYFEVFKKDWNITIPKEFPKKLKVCIYPTYDDFLKGAGAGRGTLAYYKFVAMPERDLNFFNDRSDTRMTEQVMFHECNHYLVDLFSQGLRYPHWIGESMAEYYGGSVYDERTKSVKVGQIQEGRLVEVREDIAQGKKMGVAEMITKTPQYEDYYWGWSFTHFLMETPAYAKKYRQFFVDLSRSPDVKRKPVTIAGAQFTTVDDEEVLRVFKKRMGLAENGGLDALQNEWYAYIDKLQTSGVRGYEEAGKKAFRNGERAFRAPRLLKLAIEKGSKDADTFICLSRCLRMKQEGLAEALEAVKKGCEVDPLSADVWAERGFVLQLMGSKDEGKKLVDLAYELDPSGYFVDIQTLLTTSGGGK